MYFYNFQRNIRVGRLTPDWIKSVGNGYIIVECDESRHIRHKEYDEYVRISKMFDTLAKPTIIIRINTHQLAASRGRASYRFDKYVLARRMMILEAFICLANKTLLSAVFADNTNRKMIVIYIGYSHMTPVLVYKYPTNFSTLLVEKYANIKTRTIMDRIYLFRLWVYGNQFVKRI
jgi:hypothetical protein